MGDRDRVAAVVQASGGPICDDCLADKAALSQRQTANAICRGLAVRGLVSRWRDRCAACGKMKNVNQWVSAASGDVARGPLPENTKAPELTTESTQSAERPWFCEGNIQSRIVSDLVGRGYGIKRVADTSTREHGQDIIAVSPGGQELWVSVKGYPETSAHAQARAWFSGALLELALSREENPKVLLALGVPDGFPTYLNLVRRVTWLRKTMPFSIFWATESGAVREEGPP